MLTISISRKRGLMKIEMWTNPFQEWEVEWKYSDYSSMSVLSTLLVVLEEMDEYQLQYEMWPVSISNMRGWIEIEMILCWQ